MIRRTHLMRQLEQKNGGVPVEKLIRDALESSVSEGEAAKKLGVSRATLLIWMGMLGISIRRSVQVA